ncbi:MAG: penicillin-binding protein 1C, partial [Flavobacteriales bacterium]|nr:penicillin-binding protein 1C [Flavobacteriales bacterium]
MNLAFLKKYWIPIPGLMLLALVAGYFAHRPDPVFSAPTSTVLEDESGFLLNASIAEDGQWRFPSCDSLPKKYQTALIAFEDRQFFSHSGVHLPSIARAIIQNARNGRVVSGGSTITMQVIRMSRGNPPRTVWQKITELFAAWRLEMHYSKEEILNMYASHAPMGGNIVGIDAASWRYFATPSSELTWAEAVTLAVLPNAPALIHPGRNSDQLKRKRDALLHYLHEQGAFDAFELEANLTEPLPGRPHALPHHANHLMQFAVKEGYKGKRITSTLNRNLQIQITNMALRHASAWNDRLVRNVAVLVLDNHDKSVVAYIGNATVDDKAGDAYVDIVQAPRSTGSILKPFLYGCMIEEGELMLGMLVPDIPLHFSGYAPKNYNRTFSGAVPAHRALSRSLNVPAVYMLHSYGVARFLHNLRSLGFGKLHYGADHYGLSLILGGGEASLWEITSAYSGLMHLQHHFDPESESKEVIAFQEPHWINNATQPAPASAPIHTGAAWNTLQALLDVSRPENESGWDLYSSTQHVAWKTGTSFGNRDAWAVGTTSRYTVGVWVGNADGEGRPEIVGTAAAAPLLFNVLDLLPSEPWIVTPWDALRETRICSVSGHPAGSHCEQTKIVFSGHLKEHTSA